MAAVVDFQAFTGVGVERFIVKELSVIDVDTANESHFLFKPPKEIPAECGRSPNDKWLKRHHHGLEWSQGDLDYSCLEQVVSKRTGRYRYLYCKGVEKCNFLEELLLRPVYDLEAFGCPGLKRLVAGARCARCPHHAGRERVCAHLQSLSLARWAAANRELIDLTNPSVRAATFSRWSVLLDPSRLAVQGYVHIRGTKAGIRCVYCGFEMVKVRTVDDPQKEHLKYSPDCVSFQQDKNK